MSKLFYFFWRNFAGCQICSSALVYFSCITSSRPNSGCSFSPPPLLVGVLFLFLLSQVQCFQPIFRGQACSWGNLHILGIKWLIASNIIFPVRSHINSHYLVPTFETPWLVFDEHIAVSPYKYPGRCDGLFTFSFRDHWSRFFDKRLTKLSDPLCVCIVWNARTVPAKQ